MPDNKQTKQPQAGGGPGFGFPHGHGPVEKPKNMKGTLRRLLAYLKPHGLGLAAVLVFSICATVFNIFAPKVMGKATTELFNGVIEKLQQVPGGGIDMSVIRGILVTLVILYVVSALFNYIQAFIMARVTQSVVYDLRRDVNEKLNRLPLKYYDGRSHGEILSRVTNDIDLISSTLQDSLTQAISAAVTIVGVFIMMLTISPLMTLIALVTLPASFLLTIMIAKRSQKFFSAQQKTLGELNGHIEEMYGGHTIVKAFSREEESLETFEETNDRYFQHARKAQFISGIVRPAMGFIGNLGYVAVCVVGGILVTRNSITVGDIQAFIQYMRSFTQPITQLASITNTIQSTLAAAERTFEVLDEQELKADPENPVKLGRIEGHVEFDHVNFSYVPGKTVIKDLSVDVEPGQTVAIVGPTGAGKSTLANLLMRFYEIDGGIIRVDGVDTSTMTRHDLRENFGMVLQDTWLFSGTIRDNIAYGVEEATEEQVVAAAKAAHADHFIRTLPDGYDTLINEEASNISSGQKQLLTIARAILANPAILILDEATSSIDTRTERLVQKAMKDLMANRTSFVIAHRLSTIKDADRILVIREGDIVEQGSHAELLKLGGFYADLYNSQFVDCIDEVEVA